jgi:hypothetical protein
MKAYIFIFLMLTGFTASAQYSWTTATVSLNDGSELVGEARLIKQGTGYNTVARTVQYREKKGAKKSKYNASEVSSIVFTNEYTLKIDGKETEESSEDVFKPVDVKKFNKLIFMQEIIDDKLSLYGMPVRNYKSRISSNQFPFNVGEFNIVYIKKANTSARQVTVRGLDGIISEERVADYLSNCPLMLEFIKSSGGDVTAVEVVNHYNENCD